MNSESRPGGLTTLAVFNFIGAGIGILLGLMVAMTPMLGMLPAEATADVPEQQRAQIEAILAQGPGIFLMRAALYFISGTLLIISGIGYIKLKKFLGRTMGNAYGVFGLFVALVTVFVLPTEIGGGDFGIGTMISLIYPVLTLILINTAFRDDLVN